MKFQDVAYRAIMSVHGSDEVAARLLPVAKKSVHKYIDLIENENRRGNIDKLEVSLHTLKGVLATYGAREEAGLVEAQERYIKEKKVISKELEGILKTLREFVTDF